MLDRIPTVPIVISAPAIPSQPAARPITVVVSIPASIDPNHPNLAELTPDYARKLKY